MNTYGRLDNASLVRMYGFAEHDNPNDTVSLYIWQNCGSHDGLTAGIYPSGFDQAVVI